MSQTDLFGAEARPNASNLLTTLALIQVNWDDQSKSYFDQFVPFVLGVMGTDPQRSWADGEVRNGLADRFGLQLPTSVVGSLIGRAARNGQVVRKDGSAKLTIQSGTSTDKPLDARRADCLRRQHNLVQALCRMANNTFSISWSEEEAESALAAYIEGHAVPLLAAHTRGDSLSAPAGPEGAEYIVSLFIYQITQSEPQLFDYLDEMVKGSMLASALYMAAPSVDQKFRNTTLFIDTPLCLKALGYEGDEAAQAVRQVLDMARRQDARIACFEHTLSEMRGVLEAAQSAIRTGHIRGGDFAVAARFRQLRTTPSDIERYISRLESDVRSLGMSVLARPAHTSELGLDEEALEGLLQKRIGYHNPGALTKDLDSLSAVHRARGGRSPKQLETCKAVLVTSNDSLVQVARDFFDKTKHEWPVAMASNDVAALLWVKQPHDYPDVPRTQVIADCLAALSPSSDLWERVLQETERLAESGTVTQDDLAVMRWAPEARRAVMDATLGETRKVTEKTVLDAVNRAREKVSEPITKQLDAAQQQVRDAEDRSTQLEFERLDLESQIQGYEQRESSIRSKAHADAWTAARRVHVVAIVLCCVVVAAGVTLWVADLGIISRVAAAIIAVFGISGLPVSWLGRLRERYAQWSERRRLAAVGLDADP